MPVAPLRAVLPLLAVATLALAAGCSNSESPTNKRPHSGSGTASAVGGVQQITITTGEDYRFHPSTIVVHQGQVRVILKNTAKSGAPHNFSVTGLPAAFVPLAGPGVTQTATFTAPAPGKYQFVCTIHLAQGQTGTLIVEPGTS